MEGDASRSISLSEVARAYYGVRSTDLRGVELDVTVTFELKAPSFGYGAHAAEVAIDPDTGLVSIERYVVVHDCGEMVDPAGVEGQISGGTAQGIGQALMESLTYELEWPARRCLFHGLSASHERRVSQHRVLPLFHPVSLHEIRAPRHWRVGMRRCSSHDRRCSPGCPATERAISHRAATPPRAVARHHQRVRVIGAILSADIVTSTTKPSMTSPEVVDSHRHLWPSADVLPHAFGSSLAEYFASAARELGHDVRWPAFRDELERLWVDPDGRRTIDSMDDAGISRSILLVGGFRFDVDDPTDTFQATNQQLVELASRYRDRFTVFCGTHPSCRDASDRTRIMAGRRRRGRRRQTRSAGR